MPPTAMETTPMGKFQFPAKGKGDLNADVKGEFPPAKGKKSKDKKGKKGKGFVPFKKGK